MAVPNLGADEVVPPGEKRVHLLRIELRRTMHRKTFHDKTVVARSRARAAKKKPINGASILALEVG
jgi:hypothetical protein